MAAQDSPGDPAPATSAGSAGVSPAGPVPADPGSSSDFSPAGLAPADLGNSSGGPMSGVRVIELGVWVAGPAAGGILADWGADVIKIEPPQGDPARTDIAAFWARSGVASLLTPPGANPPFQRGGMGDHSVGLAGAAAISAALFHRERTGEGQLVSTSLFRQGMYTISFDLNVLLMWGLAMGVGTRETMGNPCINNYQAGCGKRFWIVGLEGERHWPPLARAVGHPEWLEDERFNTPLGRATNAAELIGLLDEIFATKTLEEWVEVFDTEPEFFWAPVNTPEDLLADPQMRPSGALVEVPDGMTGTTMIATPIDFHGSPWSPRSLAPKLGEHTEEILKELGR